MSLDEPEPELDRAVVAELAARVTRQDARGEAIGESADKVKAPAIARATAALGRPGRRVERTVEERLRERVAYELYGWGWRESAIADQLVAIWGEGAPADPRPALRALFRLGPEETPADRPWIGSAPVGAQAITRAHARSDVRRMLAVVGHMRDGRQWYARRDQHVAVAASLRDEARQAGEYVAAATFHAQIARIEGFDAPSKTVNLHGHANIGPSSQSNAPDGPGVVGGVSVAALRALGRDGRAALVALLGEDVVARAELPASTDDEDEFSVVDAEIVEG